MLKFVSLRLIYVVQATFWFAAFSSVIASTQLHAQVVAEAPQLNSPELRVRQVGTLHSYVTKPDGSFGYELAATGSANGCDWLRFNMNSQTWQGILWQHVVWVVLPTAKEQAAKSPPNELSTAFNITGDSAILFIGGGSWKNEWGNRPPENLSPPREMKLLCDLAVQTQSPVVFLEHVPFQPILEGRFEDAIIAETFRRFLMDEGSDWPLLLPMVKSAVRCMDMTQDQLSQRFKIDVKRFTVTGASKRGWTTWLTAAVDDRVDAIAPIVIDMLNMPKQMEHQIESWGKYSEEIADYTALELHKHLSSPRGQMLQQIVDPYSYRQLLDLPKLLIFATNDRYWTLDACNMYWDDLVGPKNLMYVPNNGHGIQDFGRLIGSLAEFQRVRKSKANLPKIEWECKKADQSNYSLTVKPETSVNSCTMWIARSPSQDFRNAQWISIPMFTRSPKEYSATVDLKNQGYVAFFGEVAYGDPAHPAYLSTNITILADKQP